MEMAAESGLEVPLSVYSELTPQLYGDKNYAGAEN